MIGLLGATGYTGRLVAAELARRGLPHRLGARNRERLDRLPGPGHAERRVVDAGDAASLDDFLDGVDVLVTTVGPFSRLGMPVVEAAVRTGTPYVDSTGEPAFMAEVYERFAEAPVPVVPACGFDYVPGDLAVAVAAHDLGEPAATVTVGYELTRQAASRGTLRSAVGALRSARFASRSARVRFPEGERAAITIPWGEEVTVPRHLPGAQVTVALTAPAVASVVVPLAAGAARLLAPLLDRAVERLPEGPDEATRRAAQFRIGAEVRSARGRRSAVLVEGRDPYGLTARLLVEAALRIGGAGALTPSQALDPVPFLDAVSGEEATWSLAWRRF